MRDDDTAAVAPLPLAGLRVVEFSHMIMGPTSGLVLGDLGADVIKIEPIGKGDNTRRTPGTGAGFFPTYNRNKKSIGLDLKTPEAIALVQRLLATSDVLTENFRPGALDALGLGYEAVSANNPRLVYCSLKGFLSGPYEHRSALDEVVQMMGGLAYMTGPPGRPLRAGGPVNDLMGGMFAVIGILSALRERDRTGRGAYVKSALFENTAFVVSPHMAQYKVTGRPADPMPQRIAAWAIYDVFQSKEPLPIFVGIVSDTQWRAFCREFQRTDLAEDERLTTNAARVEARPRLMAELQQLFSTFSRADLEAKCERARLAFAPVKTPHELFDDPHLNTPGAMVPVGLPDGQIMPVPALPLEIDGHRYGLRHDVPAVGEHGPAIARELGFSDAEIASMIAGGILDAGTTPRRVTDNTPASTSSSSAVQ